MVMLCIRVSWLKCKSVTYYGCNKWCISMQDVCLKILWNFLNRAFAVVRWFSWVVWWLLVGGCAGVAVVVRGLLAGVAGCVCIRCLVACRCRCVGCWLQVRGWVCSCNVQGGLVAKGWCFARVVCRCRLRCNCRYSVCGIFSYVFCKMFCNTLASAETRLMPICFVSCIYG